jgi:predicted RNA-binding Zn ribbon-like protein
MEDFRTGNGAAWLDFLASLLGRYRDTPQEFLADPAALQAWFRAFELAPERTPRPEDVRFARELREALHAAAAAALHAVAPPSAATRTIEAALAADRPLHLRRGASGLQIARPQTAREALARLARAAVHDLAGPARAQLRACGDDTCSGIYLDPTGRRCWCSDERCGNRARVRAHRARVKAEE